MTSKDLPKEIRDELRITAAMRCYSILRESGSKSLNQQYEYISSLFHGDESASIPSHIKMLCDGSYKYKELYDIAEDSDAITSKSSIGDSNTRSRVTLKVELSRNKSVLLFTGKDITRSDLEKKGRNGKQLVSGRNILDMGKRGLANYRKALSFASKKFDLEYLTVLESGNSIEDVIEYVRVEMYQIHLKEETIKKNCCN